MVAKVAKWGNSLAIRLPHHLVKEVHFAEGTQVEIVVDKGNLVIKPNPRKHYSLEELVAAITPENLHQEIETGTALGNETW